MIYLRIFSISQRIKTIKTTKLHIFLSFRIYHFHLLFTCNIKAIIYILWSYGHYDDDGLVQLNMENVFACKNIESSYDYAQKYARKDAKQIPNFSSKSFPTEKIKNHFFFVFSVFSCESDLLSNTAVPFML